MDLALRSGYSEPAPALAGEPRRDWPESYLEAYALNSAGVADHRR